MNYEQEENTLLREHQILKVRYFYLKLELLFVAVKESYTSSNKHMLIDSVQNSAYIAHFDEYDSVICYDARQFEKHIAQFFLGMDGGMEGA